MWRTKMLLKRRQEIEQGRKAVLACHSKMQWQGATARGYIIAVSCQGKAPILKDVAGHQEPHLNHAHENISAKYPKYISNISNVFQCADHADRVIKL